MPSSDPKGAVSASTRNSPGAPAGSPVETRTVRQTRPVCDQVHTRKPPQRTQPKTDTGGTRQGQHHHGLPNGYNADRAHRRCLSSRHGQAQRARFSDGLQVPPGWGKAPQRRENRPVHQERPDRTRRGTPTGGHRARQRGTPPATSKPHGQVPSNNRHQVLQARAARTTCNKPRQRNRCSKKESLPWLSWRA